MGKVPPSPTKGEPNEKNNIVWELIKLFVIPIAFIIGSIIYFKKNKSSKKRKIITLIVSLILVIAICFGINYIIKNNL